MFGEIVPDHAGFAAAITVREGVLRAAIQAAYANGSDTTKKFTEDMSGDGIEMVPDLFIGQPAINCEGATNLLVANLPMWGRVTVILNEVGGVADLFGEIELTITPTFKTGLAGTDTESSLVLDPVATVISVRRWTATITSDAPPPAIVAVVMGEEFRARFEGRFRQGFFFGLISLPSIDASFLGPIARKATTVDARVRDGVLLIGLNYTDTTHNLRGQPEILDDFALSNDVAAVVHPDAVDVLLDDLHSQLVDGVSNEGATLDSFSVLARDGYFYVRGAASNSEGAVNFSFRVVADMFHTRPGASWAQYVRKPIRVYSRTWPALGFRIEDVQTNVDRAWLVILFGEVILGVLSAGLSILFVEGMVSAAASNFSGSVKAAKLGAPAARIRQTNAPPGGIGVRIGLDQFEVSESGVFVGISVSAKPSLALLFGPTAVPGTYRNDILRYYILRLPSGVAENDPALHIRWILEDRTNNVVLKDSDGSAAGRLRFEFSPGSFAADDFGITARVYRQLGVTVLEIAIQSVNLHMRPALPLNAYVRWRSASLNPQLAVDEATDTWKYRGDVRVFRYSEWHRVDAPCLAVNTAAQYRYEVEHVDKLPFSLRLLENHRKGLCPYCFYDGPAGINSKL